MRYPLLVAKLIFSAITSLDGYAVDADGNFDWAAPDEQVHAFVNDRERPIGTYLYGRRMYQTMKAWQTMHEVPDQSEVTYDYARIWQAADKVVYSQALSGPETPRTRIERRFDPEAVRQLLTSAERDVSIGGPTLAANALRAGLVDEVQQFICPVAVGGGMPFLPPGVWLELELLDERRFDSGVVYLRYANKSR
jgi:dihydrofolate reductase